MPDLNLKQRIPVTVIGGFLGAGKTTLVNSLIRSGAYKFGVIVNEFGETGVDGSLIEKMDSDGIAELSNGCLCCFGRDDLVQSLVKLAMREHPPEYVLVELSGVADPVPVAQTVLDPYVKGLFELDGIIGVADARNLKATIQQNPEGAVQLAYASTVILNKIDLANPEQIEEAKQMVEKLNPLVSIQEASHAEVPFSTMLHTRAFEPRWENAPDYNAETYRAEHTKGLKSFTLRADRPLNRQGFNRFIETMIVARPDQVYRAKGFISIEGFDKHVLFQSVREIFNLNLAEGDSDGKTNLVIIGKSLDKAEFQAAFDLTLKPPSLFETVRRTLSAKG
ncbi:MAG: CobW family GTP-binding protein [Trueperaceae bacterium]